ALLYAAGLAMATVTAFGWIAAIALLAATFHTAHRGARSLADRLVYGKRATPFEVLSEFSERVGGTYSIDEILPRMAELLGVGTGAAEVRVWLLAGQTLAEVASWPTDLTPLPEHTLAGSTLPGFWDVGVLDVHVEPVTHQGELLGAITLKMDPHNPLDTAKKRLTNGLATQAGLSLRNVALVRDLRASRRRIVSAQDERAKRLERDIHDGAQQQLVAIAVQLKL